MNQLWTIIGVKNVPASLEWYLFLLGLPQKAPAHDYFGQITNSAGDVLLCLHQWGTHEHPTLTNPLTVQAGNGLILFFRVADFDEVLSRAYQLTGKLEADPLLNLNTGTLEFSLRDPDRYYVTISALDQPAS